MPMISTVTSAFLFLEHSQFLILMKYNLSFSFCWLFLVPYLRIFCQIQDHEDLSLFSFKSFIGLAFTLKSFDPFWVNLCTWCEIRIQLYSFGYGFLIVLEHNLLKRLLFLYGMALASLSKSVGHRHRRLFLGSQFYFIGLSICPYASTTQSWLLLLCTTVGFEIRNCEVPLLCSFSRLFWLLWVLDNPTWILESACQFLQRQLEFW